ncbi:MAG: hypothetical protein K0M50_15835 [Prolixibacteraceae bacterium]|nr:hypothetical protein [Prolixibacteraceae bacterium]
MKKVSLVLGMVLAVSMAMAQNVSLVEQVGNSNGATVAQTGSLNDATAKQIGNSDVALVKQVGTSNIGVSDQINGNTNTSTIDQNGTSNQAYLTQGMIPSYYAAPYNISSSVSSSNSVGSIKQIGIENYSEFVQVGPTNAGSVNQNGKGNTAYIYEGWPFGFWGETSVTSALASSNSTVDISQTSGNDNFGAVWLYGGDKNKVTINQTGSNNNSQITAGFIYDDANYNFSRPVYNVDNNTAAVTQIGNSNVGKLMQLGNDNTFTLTQNGNLNKVGSAPGGLEPSRNGYFKQDGDNNTFDGVQTDGAVLDATSAQTGNSNDIDMVQGAGDVAKILQTGDFNDVFLTQMGGGQNATILQTGNSNIATVSQQ